MKDIANVHLNMTLQIKPLPIRQMDPTTLTVHLRDAEGRPLNGAEVSADLVMPSMNMGRNRVRLKATGPGAYSGSSRFSMDGGWDVVVTAVKGADKAVQTFPVPVR